MAIAEATTPPVVTRVVEPIQITGAQEGFPLGIADIVSLALVVLISMGVAALVTSFSISLARKWKVLAMPDARSSHQIPTPRLGGFGIFIPMTIVLAAILIKPIYLYGPAWGVEPAFKTFFRLALVCGSLAFVIGLMDDFLRLPPWFKLLGQIVCAVLFLHLGSQIEYTVTARTLVEGTRRTITRQAVFSGIGFEHVALTSQLVLDSHWTNLVAKAGNLAERIPPLPVLVTFLWILLLMNAYNFMDGIDGLAGTFLVAVAIGLFAVYIPEAGQHMLGLKAHIFVVMATAALMIGVTLGFLFYNWPPATTFLGDGGSQYVGFILAAFLAQMVRAAGQPAADAKLGELDITLDARAYVDFLAVVILVFPFLYDVTYTMLRRLVRLKPIWRAHHEHLYQRLIERGWGHRRVVLFSLPFYLAHAALFYAYCWAPSDAVRWRLAAAALVPMLLYTAIVIGNEMRPRPAPLETKATQPAGEPGDDRSPADQEEPQTDNGEEPRGDV